MKTIDDLAKEYQEADINTEHVDTIGDAFKAGARSVCSFIEEKNESLSSLYIIIKELKLNEFMGVKNE